MPQYRARLAKEDFKFSAAHFTVFASDDAEPLHGHNYRVLVELRGGQTEALGFLVDFRRVKDVVRQCCSRLDNKTLVPNENPYLQHHTEKDAAIIRFADREYRIPQQEVLLVDTLNITVEELARLLWSWIESELRPLDGIDQLSVAVEETSGQLCWYEDAP